MKLDIETAFRIHESKRKLVCELGGTDFLLKQAAADFLEKKWAYEHRRAV